MPTRICLECMARSCQHVEIRRRTVTLTSREQAILRELGSLTHSTEKEMAAELGMAYRTLKQHLGEIYLKLGYGGPGSLLRVVIWARLHHSLLSLPDSKVA